VGTKKIPIGFCAIRNTDEMRSRIQRLYMVDLTHHAIEECLFSVLRRRPYVNCVQTLAMLVIQRNAARHGFSPLLVTDQFGLDHRPDMRGQILQSGLQARAAMVLLQVFQNLCGGAVRKSVSAVHVHNALRGSGPGQNHAFDNALAPVGCPDRRIDRLCIKCCSPMPTRHGGNF
jgi:hypothetical protein